MKAVQMTAVGDTDVLHLAEKNQLIVGWDQPDTPGLYVKTCTVGTVSWVNKPITATCKVEAQPRYRSNADMTGQLRVGLQGRARRQAWLTRPSRKT